MKTFKFLIPFAVCILFSGMQAFASGPEVIIPVPSSYSVSSGNFVIASGAQCFVEAAKTLDKEDIALFKKSLADSQFAFQISTKKNAPVRFHIGTAAAVKAVAKAEGIAEEAYSLSVTAKGADVYALTTDGAFHALESMVQMAGWDKGAKGVWNITCCSILDAPRFEYRGLHMDVSRNFRSKEFVMKQLDAMALLKLNRLHWHLTDGAGWRLEIDSYPRLTEVGAWRTFQKFTDWRGNGKFVYTPKGTKSEGFGGYYTKDDVREILAYAAERHITIVPEIEMPSHSSEVLVAYPELSCEGEPYVSNEFCIGNEKTFELLEAVLTEVIELFPSEYIHIGGDEAGQGHWRKCEKCQALMKREGLKSEDELQSYMIKRIEAFVESKGRHIIGWDEILNGGLAPHATVMSWRGIEGGKRAVEMGHDVIMTPEKWCYLDHYQDAPFHEPEAISGYTPLSKLYGYDPTQEIGPADSLYHVLGMQGNLWSEYVPTEEHCEYMYYPRAFAIAETGWSKPELKDYENFHARSLDLIEDFHACGYNTFDLANEYGERKVSNSIINHKGYGKKVTYVNKWNDKYPSALEAAFTDGARGSWTYTDARWQGFLSDIDVTIDLEEVTPIHYVMATFMQVSNSGVYMPEKVEVSVSENGKDWTFVGDAYNELSRRVSNANFRDYIVPCEISARYVRYHAIRGEKGEWLFTDEIVIN